jgi:hypothetical protein
MPPRPSLANITAHALPSGDGEKMKIARPTNDPRPPFRRTRKHNSITNPPFTRKGNLLLVSSEGARGDQDEPGSHTTTAHTAPRTWRAERELFTYASQAEPGQNYRSCATEWGWREDENRPPYKRPKAIVQANAKTQLNYQPTFHTERNPVAGIIWSLNEPPHTRPARTTETKRQQRAGQTSCTSVHKANLGSQLSIFDTGSSARARPRPNDPPERVEAGALKRPARTTETKRQGRAGQTSCTSVHKANLGSQLSIFDTGSSARARPRPNDPPERVQAGALKRPARTTESKRQGRAGQTSCTSVHKANLGSQLSIFDTGSSARARPRPNDPPERVHAGALTRPARTTETKRQGRAGQTSCTSVHKANLGSQLSIFDTGSSARARPRPNDPPERVQQGALKRPGRTTETRRQGRAGQTSCTSVHKANLGSQLSIFDTGSSARARPRPNDPPERVQPGALKRPARTTETKRQGRAGQTSCTSVHKANLGSQLSIFDTGSSARARPQPKEFTRAPSNDPPERPKRSDKGEPGKRAARACTKPTSGHNLAFLIRARPPGRALARTTRPNEFTRARSKRPARTTETKRQGRAGQTSCTSVHKANLGSQLSIFDTGSSARARPRPNDPPERVHAGALKRPARTTETKRQGRAGQTSCTSVHKANLGSQLSIFDTGSSARARPRPNDPPERVQPGALKRPARTTETKRQGRAGQTSCTSVHKANLGSQLSIFDTGSSARARPRPNDPPERVHAGALKRPARTTETKRQGRAGQTSCTSVHKANLGSQLSIFDTGSSARARPRPNDPPERVQPGALKRPARTTETKRQGRAGQTSCTSVHKANLGSQLSIFDTGSSARARPRPNDPPERVQPGALKRPARTTETKRQGRAGQTSCTSVHKANLGSQLSIFDTGSSARARPRPNDPPERVQPGALKRPARTTETKRQGRAGQTSCTSVHKANLGSQLSIFDTGSSARARPRPNDPPERVQPGALKRPARTTETKRQGRAGQTSCTSVHKANLGSQLSIFDTGSSARARPRPNDPPERVHPGALKRPARTTETKRQGRAGQTSCTSVHKANLGSQLSIFDTGSSARARPRPNDPPERVQPGALKRPARTTETKRQGRAGQTSCTSVHKANLGSQLSIFDTGSSARARPRPNDPPERVHPGALKRPARTTETKRQGRAGQTSCTSVHKANLGSQLSIFDTGSSARARPRPNDPPERVHPGALKRPARTTETKRQGRAGQTSCTSVHKANLGSQLSIFDTGSSARARPRPNDPPERVQPGALKRPARTTETKRQGRAGQTSCTSVHKANLGSQLSIFDTGSSARARPRPNDPPERVQPGALKRPARTTETKRQRERVHTGALKRPPANEFTCTTTSGHERVQHF